MDITKLARVADSAIEDSYDSIGRNYAKKFFKEQGKEGFEESLKKWRYRNKEEAMNAAKDEFSKLVSGKTEKPKEKKERTKSDEEKIKEELYKLTKQFVQKYQRQYYPAYKGELDDLVSDFYAEFLTPKSRERGKEESLLDKFDENVTSLPYLVKVAVQRKLIDRSRSDKGEKNYVEKYDEETGDLSLDWIAEHADDDEIQLEDIEFSDDEIFELRDMFDEMPEAKKKAFIKYYKEVKDVLAPNFKKLFADLVEGKVQDSNENFDYLCKRYRRVLDSCLKSSGEEKEHYRGIIKMLANKIANVKE